jgi:two-component system NtrC family sensor kinase
VTTKRVDKDKVGIDFEDNGPGVSDEVKNKIFQPFFTTKKGTDGTGLGLSITHDIINNHKGKVKIVSKENVFTRFEIELPLTTKKTKL